MVATRRANPRRARAKVPRLGRIVYARSGRWWVATMPSFPGAYSQGRTRDEAYRSLLLAIRELVDTYVALARRAARRRAAA
jgi:predicted RNase H-like HicB family nuclease